MNSVSFARVESVSSGRGPGRGDRGCGMTKWQLRAVLLLLLHHCTAPLMRMRISYTRELFSTDISSLMLAWTPSVARVLALALALATVVPPLPCAAFVQGTTRATRATRATDCCQPRRRLPPAGASYEGALFGVQARATLNPDGSARVALVGSVIGGAVAGNAVQHRDGSVRLSAELHKRLRRRGCRLVAVDYDDEADALKIRIVLPLFGTTAMDLSRRRSQAASSS